MGLQTDLRHNSEFKFGVECMQNIIKPISDRPTML